MQKLFKLAIPVLGLALLTYSCQKNRSVDLATDVVPQEVIDKLTHMGFNPDGIEKIEEGYRIERDIIITDEFLRSTPTDRFVPNLEQYRTSNLVNAGGGRVITIYAPEETGGGGGNGKKGGGGGGDGYSPAMIAGLDEAIARYNAENLTITFQRVTSSSGADIVMSRLSKGDERRGVLGSAGFPSGGDPYGQILMSGVLESSYGLSTDGIATIIAHEMGHCIGLRHTDYFDRSISCGGGPYDEGQAGVGAIHIPGTPTGADLQGNGSYMLSCTDGSNRDFTPNDKTALDYLY